MKTVVNKLLGKQTKQNDGLVKLAKGALFSKQASVKLHNCSIQLEKDAELVLHENVTLSNYHIHIIAGRLEIGAFTQMLGAANGGTSLVIEKGSLHIAHHCVVKAEFSVRFGGQCSIAEYSGIMDGTEIRCDERVSIGAYNMISYECMIYDTNTHCEYAVTERRKRTMADFPNIGAEKDKPTTAPVLIGNDCWLGKRSVILKGVHLGDNSTVAACAVLTKSAPAGSLVYGNPALFRAKSKE